SYLSGGIITTVQDGCLSDLVTDTDAFLFSAGADDTIGISGTFLYARSGGTTITDPTTGGHTYTNQGDGVVCNSPRATAHHGDDSTIHVRDLLLKGRVSYTVTRD